MLPKAGLPLSRVHAASLMSVMVGEKGGAAPGERRLIGPSSFEHGELRPRCMGAAMEGCDNLANWI